MVHSRKGKHTSLSVVDSNYNDLTFWCREKLPAGPSGAHQDLLEELHANCSSPTKSKSPTSAFLSVIFSAAGVLEQQLGPGKQELIMKNQKSALVTVQSALSFSQGSKLSLLLKPGNSILSWIAGSTVIAKFSVCLSLFSLWHQIKLLLRQINDLPHWQASEGLTT